MLKQSVVEPTWICALKIMRGAFKSTMDSLQSSERRTGSSTLANQMMSVVSAPSAFPTRPLELPPVWDASGRLASAGIDKDFALSAGNILQILLCLSNLTRADANDSVKVREYADLTDERLLALSELMRPMLWNLA
jgi:hypothetical protein